MSRKGALFLVVALTALLIVTGGAWLLVGPRTGTPVPTAGQTKAAVFFCPMHPRMTSDHPGDCPICGMRMVLREDAEREHEERNAVQGSAPEPTAGPLARSTPVRATTQPKRRYRSTMNPGEVSDRPGKDSMGMEMVPVEEENETPSASPKVPGLATVRLSAGKRQLIGVKTVTAVASRFRREIRAVGHVEHDEAREKHVTTKTAGYVEVLYANTLWERFEKGRPLLELYSPELLASQQEYLLALDARKRTSGSSLPSVAASGDQLVTSARRRLELFDVSEAQIRALEETGKPSRTVTLRAPISGLLSHRAVTQGDKVESGTHLLDLTDLSRVWVLASVYEYELPFVRQGMTAEVTLTYVPGKTFSGKVALVYPVLDPATRTALVRIEVANPELLLKPDMFADVALAADMGSRLSLPDDAVMETGDRSVVFVDAGDGYFEPREVSVGIRLADRYEITRGLREGEKVLASANFFIDSESKLKAAWAETAEAPGRTGHEK